MGREFELKFSATEAIQQAILAQYPNGHTIAMETTYFDTADGSLSAQKITLRLRRENDITVCTLKTPLSDGSKGEWECQADDLAAGLQSLSALGIPVALPAPEQLHRVCGARFLRHAIPILLDGGSAELAVDRGVLLGGGRELPLCEVEVELKSGPDAVTLAFAAELAKTYGLKPESKSKFRRARDLAAGV